MADVAAAKLARFAALCRSGQRGTGIVNEPWVQLLTRLIGDLLAEAQATGVAIRLVEASKVFGLATAVSWAVDRFGDNEQAARRRVEVATSGLFPSPSA